MSQLVLNGIAKNPVFIGGLMKSGTSLLRVLLGQHPLLYASFETHWFTDDVRKKWHVTTSQRMKLLLELFNLKNDEYINLCGIKNQEPDREFIDIFLNYCAVKDSKERWIEKTPDNIKYWSLIKKQWKNPKFIHVTREYKDCYASWKSKRGDNIEEFLKKTINSYDDIKSILGKNTTNYMEIDYTELVFDTENSIKKILEFIECPFNKNCLYLGIGTCSNVCSRKNSSTTPSFLINPSKSNISCFISQSSSKFT